MLLEKLNKQKIQVIEKTGLKYVVGGSGSGIIFEKTETQRVGVPDGNGGYNYQTQTRHLVHEYKSDVGGCYVWAGDSWWSQWY